MSSSPVPPRRRHGTSSSSFHADESTHSSLSHRSSRGGGTSTTTTTTTTTTRNCSRGSSRIKRRTSVKIEAIQLDFDEPKLFVGRNDEVEIITKVYHSVIKDNDNDASSSELCNGELVILHGKAGAGKTAVVESLRNELWKQDDDDNNDNEHNSNNNNNNNTLYARAKFELPDASAGSSSLLSSSSSSNLEPIARACAELCDAMSKLPQCDTYRQRILDNLGLGVGAFTQFVPSAVPFLLPKQANSNSNDSNNKQLSNSGRHDDHDHQVVVIREERGFERLKVLISLFIHAVCGGNQHPTMTPEQQQRTVVVLFFDDLQWADEGCMEILRFLAAGKQKWLLLIVSHRDDDEKEKEEESDNNKNNSNNKDKESPLAQTLKRLEQDIHVTKIHVQELDQDGVNQIISGLIDDSLEETQPLAEIVYQKTRGNAFFVMQFLRSIEADGYLYFSAGSLRWKWDLESIESQTHISDNVVDFVTQKIQRLPDEAQAALKIAACLGSTIHTKIVDYLASATTTTTTPTSLFSGGCNSLDETVVVDRQQAWIDIFDSLAEEGLVNKRKRGSRTYTWSHDRILESAYRLVPPGDEQKLIHLQIGKALMQLEDCPLGESWKIITATDQLNRASSIIADEAERVELAQMNLTAAKTVASISAFYQAARYLRAGVELLAPSTMWNAQHYELSLELHNSLAEMEKYVGHHDACRQAAKQVLEHGHSLSDQFRSHMVLIDSLGSKGEFGELLNVVSVLTRRLGEPLPRKPSKMRLLLEIVRTNRMIGKRTDEDLWKAPAITDERVLQLLTLFNRLNRLTWYAGKIELTVFIRLRMMQMFVQHGCCEFSGPAVALYGSILAKMGKLDQAYRFGSLALRLCERFPIEETQTSIYVFVHLTIIKKPLSHSIEPLLQAHRSGLEKGDSIVSGGLAYTVFYFYQGLPLRPMQEDARAFATHMAQGGNEAFATFVNFYRQLALNFMGQSNNFLVLSGEAIDIEKVERQATEQKNHVMLLFSWTSQMLLACFSGDQELSIAMFQKLEKADLLPEFYPGPAILGLVSAFLARSTGIRKYARRAISIMKQLSALTKKGSVNYVFSCLLLKAELAALQKRDELATKLFEAAMRAAAQSGLTNFGALAAERYGMYALERDRGDTYWAETHFSRAVFLYSEWGAEAKVESMKRMYPLLTSETSFSYPRSTHHLGRRRLEVKDVYNGSFRQVEMRVRATDGDDDSCQLDHTEIPTESEIF